MGYLASFFFCFIRDREIILEIDSLGEKSTSIYQKRRSPPRERLFLPFLL